MSKLMQTILRDDLFKSDLIYEISRLAGLIKEPDEVIEKRIKIRLQSLPVEVSGVCRELCSGFNFEILSLVKRIGKKVGSKFETLEEISGYPELVKEELGNFWTGENLTEVEMVSLKLKIEADVHLFYSDLIYKIRRLAGLVEKTDKVIEERIKIRYQMLPKMENGIICYRLSPFEKEMFEFAIEISKKVGVAFTSLQELSKYPELVKDTLKQYEGPSVIEYGDKRKKLGILPTNPVN